MVDMNIFNKIMDETSQCKDEIFQHVYKNNNLEYKSSLRGFNSKLFLCLNLTMNDLKVSESIQSLFKGDIVNETENQSALHHVYRDMHASCSNNFASAELIESCRLNIEKCIRLQTGLN